MQGFKRPLCARLLRHGDHHRKQRHNYLYDRFAQITQNKVDHPTGDQQRQHGLPDHFQCNAQR